MTDSDGSDWMSDSDSDSPPMLTQARYGPYFKADEFSEEEDREFREKIVLRRASWSLRERDLDERATLTTESETVYPVDPHVGSAPALSVVVTPATSSVIPFGFAMRHPAMRFYLFNQHSASQSSSAIGTSQPSNPTPDWDMIVDDDSSSVQISPEKRIDSNPFPSSAGMPRPTARFPSRSSPLAVHPAGFHDPVVVRCIVDIAFDPMPIPLSSNLRVTTNHNTCINFLRNERFVRKEPLDMAIQTQRMQVQCTECPSTDFVWNGRLGEDRGNELKKWDFHRRHCEGIARVLVSESEKKMKAQAQA